MGGAVNTVIRMLKKAGYFILQYLYILFYWLSELIRIQLQRMKRSSAQKDMQRAYGILGGEIYALYKNGETNWPEMTLVQQALTMVEDAERRVFQVDETIEAIHSNYLSTREEIRARYALRRAAVDNAAVEEMQDL